MGFHVFSCCPTPSNYITIKEKRALFGLAKYWDKAWKGKLLLCSITAYFLSRRKE